MHKPVADEILWSAREVARTLMNLRHKRPVQSRFGRLLTYDARTASCAEAMAVFHNRLAGLDLYSELVGLILHPLGLRISI